jgi:hypothetical protein
MRGENKMKYYHTKSKATIKRAILADQHPISLFMLELKSITPSMEGTEANRLARLLIELVKNK